MINFGKAVVKFRIPILIISLLLLIPAGIGYFGTRVNYDILSYLPKDIETMQGQDILKEQFGTGAYSMLVIENMSPKDVSELKSQIMDVDHVENVIWYDSVMDISVPMEVLPEEVYEAFNSDDATLLMVIFDETTAEDGTMEAVENIRKVTNKQCFLAGMSAIVTDTKNITEKETVMYVVIAMVLSALILLLTMDSFAVPFIFLISIGMAIVYNLGSNIIFGEISYITKALAAVLQLAVTMDYSIFLWNSFKENQERYPNDDNRAMAHAISNTLSSVVGSSITTVAGFVALCFMSYKLGLDLGLVMAKGVIIGVLTCVTVLPTFVLTFEKLLLKTKHRSLLPEFKGVGKIVTKFYPVIVIVAIILLVPFTYGQFHANVYYNLDSTLPAYLDSVKSNAKLNSEFELGTVHMLLCDADCEPKTVRKMSREMKEVDGVKYVLGLDTVSGGMIPDGFVTGDITDKLQNENWKLMLIGSDYNVATDEVNNQISELQQIVKNYDNNAMLIGEAPCTKDLINITDHDFKVVNIASIGLVFLIIMIVFRSISLPVILVSVIELAIFINMGIPYFTGSKLPFIASIVIGTIQLGSTVDYAILMTTRYKRERVRGCDKAGSVRIAASSSAKSIVISALSFFAATVGVGLYSDVDLIGSLCILMSRGALISMVVVIFVLPSMLMVFDKLIMKTSLGFQVKDEIYPDGEARFADR